MKSKNILLISSVLLLVRMTLSLEQLQKLSDADERNTIRSRRNIHKYSSKNINYTDSFALTPAATVANNADESKMRYSSGDRKLGSDGSGSTNAAVAINAYGEDAAPTPKASSEKDQVKHPASDSSEAASNRGKNAALVMVSLLAALAMSSVVMLAVYYLHVLKKGKLDKPYIQETGSNLDFHKSATQFMLPSMQVSSAEAQVFTYKQLQFATSNFSPANELSPLGGSTGSMYKGVLPNGTISLIKQLDIRGKQVDLEFRIEVDLLSRLHSPYLLELIGYCADQDHRLLVYEYMSNGNLEHHLYSTNRGGGGNGPKQPLDWATRLRIALDAARGLEYLHEYVYPPIIHRDFKTSNIFLSDDYSAKISDFGLAKLGSDKMNGQVITRVLGTQGYVAPEYALTGQLTTKSDVYSFGVVLLELLTGRSPVDMNRANGEAVLVSWALPRLTDRNKIHEIVDPSMDGQYTMKELIQVGAIAAMCVQPEADYRPLMTDVVQSLVPLVKQALQQMNTLPTTIRSHLAPPRINHQRVPSNPYYLV